MLLADARTVRARLLMGLGSRSYGSAVRRHIRVAPVALVGTGMLAQEILPFLGRRTAASTSGAVATRSIGRRRRTYRSPRDGPPASMAVGHGRGRAVRAGADRRLLRDTRRRADRSSCRRRAIRPAAGAVVIRSTMSSQKCSPRHSHRSEGGRGEGGDSAVRACVCHPRQAESVGVA